MDAEELKARTKQFALRIIRVVDALPHTTSGRAIGNQLVRAGTAVGANYRAACRGRSRAEFIAKLGVVIEEADECGYWLELIMEIDLLPRSKVESLSIRKPMSLQQYSSPQYKPPNQKSAIISHK